MWFDRCVHLSGMPHLLAQSVSPRELDAPSRRSLLRTHWQQALAQAGHSSYVLRFRDASATCHRPHAHLLDLPCSDDEDAKLVH